MNGNDLVIQNTISDLILEQGEAYQINSAGQRIDMTWQPTYAINGNYVNINVGDYSASLPLIIELDKGVAGSSGVMQVENLLWSTFYGGVYGDAIIANKAANDNVWVTGVSKGVVFLDKSGPTSDELLYNDGFVARFDLDNAEFLWITRLEGESSDNPKDIDVNTSNNHIFVVGFTLSSNLFDQTGPGMNDLTLNGFSDGFIIELDPFGVSSTGLLKSFIGGNGSESCMAVEYQPFTNDAPSARLYIAGYTSSESSSFPLQIFSNGYNQSQLAGGRDGFVLRLGSDFELEWGTYFGSSEDDIITDISTDAIRTVITGQTKASSSSFYCSEPTNGGFPLCDNIGPIQSSYNQNTAYFISEFTNDQLAWSTFAGGTEENIPYHTTEPSVNILDSGWSNIYFFSETTSPNLSYILSPYVNSFNLQPGEGRSNIRKYNSDRELVWSSALGEGFISSRMRVFNYNNYRGVFIVGASSNGLLSGALPLAEECQVPLIDEYAICNFSGQNYMEINSNNTIESRMYLMMFDEYDQLKWATFFGNDGGSSFQDVSFSGNKVVMIGRGRNNTIEEYDQNSTLDYYQPINSNTQETDGAIAMFDLDDVILGLDDELNESNDDMFF